MKTLNLSPCAALVIVSLFFVGCGDGAVNRVPGLKERCSDVLPVSDELPTECAELDDLLSSEIDKLRLCDGAADCGKTFSTSCGCTRNAVLRRDSDTTRLCQIQQAMTDLQCDRPASTCDCPEVDGFIYEENKCRWNYI